MKKILMIPAILAFGVSIASATVEIRISNGASGDTGWITCGGTACAFSGTVGNYTFTSDISTQDNSINPFLDMTYSARTSSATAGTLIIEAMADGYTTNSPQFELVGNGNGTIQSSSITIAAYGGSNNSICATSGCSPSGITNTIVSQNFTDPPNGYGFDLFGSGNSANPYSLGLSYTITSPTTAGSLSGDLQLDAVPEPTSVLLLGTGLLALASFGRKKLSRNAR